MGVTFFEKRNRILGAALRENDFTLQYFKPIFVDGYLARFYLRNKPFCLYQLFAGDINLPILEIKKCREAEITKIRQRNVGEGKLTSAGRSTKEISYFVAEPSFAAGFHLGRGFRLLFSASYLYMNNANTFGGITMGIRIDIKTETTVKEINE